MMDLLRNHYATTLDEVEKEICDTYAILRPFMDSENYKAKMALLKSHMEILNRDLAKRKDHKFQRDSMAFNNGKAYKWKKTDDDPSDRNKAKIDRNNSDKTRENERPERDQYPNRDKPHSQSPMKTTQVMEETVLTMEDIDLTDHLPLPSRSPPHISNQDTTQFSVYFSVYSTDEDISNVTSQPKRIRTCLGAEGFSNVDHTSIALPTIDTDKL